MEFGGVVGLDEIGEQERGKRSSALDNLQNVDFFQSNGDTSPIYIYTVTLGDDKGREYRCCKRQLLVVSIEGRDT
ncbi:hypothetical protein TSUD_115610 [Trifolium subterraneum]|uniref:Uncharacterized protein n=1 Tax=Trifolium subterraneum TaxID=3900 RepID=A0A2Z6NCZ3_TRISU|nr:hypothetical protein TSUD_115610 [Trifolium subterraneum]